EGSHEPDTNFRGEVGQLAEAPRVRGGGDIVPQWRGAHGLACRVDHDAAMLLPGDRDAGDREVIRDDLAGRLPKRLPPILRILDIGPAVRRPADPDNLPGIDIDRDD